MSNNCNLLQIGQTIISLLTSTVGKPAFDQIQQEISHVFKYQSLEDLERNIENLRNEKERVKKSVDQANRQGEEIYEHVDQFLSSVNDIIKRVDESIIKHKDEAKRKCCKGLLPNLLMRYKLNKKAAKAIKDCAHLLEKVKNGTYRIVSYPSSLPRIDLKNLTRDYEAFGTRIPILNRIIEALKDANVNMIGVYGMAGVGKTTLVKEVASRVMKEELFDIVVMAEVTQNPDYKNIQDKIAYDLNLKFGTQESEYERIGRLSNWLKKEKSILIILDNIWEKFDLNVVGIPFDEIKTSKIIDPRICKILLTSRNRDLLHNDMNTQKEFLVKTISDEEAKNLFEKMVGNMEELPNFKSIMVKIVKKCGGLPAAIATMANALKNKNISVWEDALTRLEGSSSRQIEGMDAKVFSTIELSYKFLKNDQAKLFFLLCSLHNVGHEIYIYELLRFGIGLGLFQDARTLEQKRNSIRASINDLKDSCLLLDGDTKDTVIMHNMVYIVATSIASTEKRMLNIQDAFDLEKDIHKESIALSLHVKKINELPKRLGFPKLKLFLFSERQLFLQFPDLFFQGMKELKVLDLRGIPFTSLPSSFDYLTNLQSLSLEACLLGDITIVGVLKKLEILNISNSNIEHLPEKIGHLTRLRLLDLRNCPKLKVIAPKVISSLSLLEELYMDNTSLHWKEEYSNIQGQNFASLSELKKLSQLTT